LPLILLIQCDRLNRTLATHVGKRILYTKYGGGFAAPFGKREC